MRDRCRLPLRFDAAAMQADVRRFADREWIQHFVKQNYDGDWSVLPLRSTATATHPVQMIYSDPTCDSFVDTPLLALCPSIATALATFACPVLSVRLMRLGAGSVIKTHSDLDLDVEHGRLRLHVPIVTNDRVDFRLNGERVMLREGECWYLRLSDPHSVTNGGDTDRVHLVIDAIVNEWLMDLLRRSVA
jgi:Aspartyl/Asparaginyl beta-hydroxylase